MKHATPGTVSHGTLRAADLIPAFMAALDALANANCYTSDGDERELTLLNAKVHMALGELERQIEQPDFLNSEAADYALETLTDLLDAYAPPGHYFGTHPGDGSDFGFWPNEAEGGEDADRAHVTITREEARTAVMALHKHASACNVSADACMQRRSSDRDYAFNVNMSESAREYRKAAAECEALRDKLNAWITRTA